MFQPPIFEENRPEVMYDMMMAHPFATIVSLLEGCLNADHVPLVLKGTGETGRYLQGHVSVANPLFRETDSLVEVLTIFQGPQTYVTPAWYVSKQEHGKVVPTWNYVVVHARGELRFTRDPSWLRQHLEDLTDQHERHRTEPWAVSDAPEEFMARQVRGLAGFEIAIKDLTGKWKVSQNRAREDRAGVQAGLARLDDPDATEIARLVKERGRG